MAISNPIRIMHFADVHFGVENYGRFDPQSGLPTRLMDFRDALNSAIEIALSADIELALFAGDAYKTRDPNQTHQRELAACLGKLTARGIPVVMLAGNHDIPNTRGRANLIEIFGALAGQHLRVFDMPDVDVIETSKGNRVQVAAMPYLIKSLVLARDEYKDKGVQDTTQLIVDKYTQGINQLAAKCEPDLPTVLMGHFTVANSKLSAGQVGYLTNEPEVPLSALTQAPFDYVALGHIHRYQDLNKGEQPPVVYAGSIERIDFGERSEEKGFALVELSAHGALVRHVPVPTRSFIEISVDATDAGEEATEKILDAIQAHETRNAVVKLAFKVKSEQTPFVRKPEIRAALNNAFLVVAFHEEIMRDDHAIRSKLMTEALEPLQALATYCDSNEMLRHRKEELLAAATPLLRQLEREETVN